MTIFTWKLSAKTMMYAQEFEAIHPYLHASYFVSMAAFKLNFLIELKFNIQCENSRAAVDIHNTSTIRYKFNATLTLKCN